MKTTFNYRLKLRYPAIIKLSIRAIRFLAYIRNTVFVKWFLLIIGLLIYSPLRYIFKFCYKKYIIYLLEKKVKHAVKFAKLENRRYIVTTFFGKPQCYTKQQLKVELKKRTFKKGVTIEQLEKTAYFVTAPGKTSGRPKAEKVGIN
jgi:hypothetical protein